MQIVLKIYSMQWKKKLQQDAVFRNIEKETFK